MNQVFDTHSYFSKIYFKIILPHLTTPNIHKNNEWKANI
jgi:hypothetical protein